MDTRRELTGRSKTAVHVSAIWTCDENNSALYQCSRFLLALNKQCTNYRAAVLLSAEAQRKNTAPRPPQCPTRPFAHHHNYHMPDQPLVSRTRTTHSPIEQNRNRSINSTFFLFYGLFYATRLENNVSSTLFDSDLVLLYLGRAN